MTPKKPNTIDEVVRFLEKYGREGPIDSARDKPSPNAKARNFNCRVCSQWLSWVDTNYTEERKLRGEPPMTEEQLRNQIDGWWEKYITPHMTEHAFEWDIIERTE